MSAWGAGRHWRLLALLLLACQPAEEIATVEGLGSFHITNPSDLIQGVHARGELWEPEVVDAIRRHARPGSVVVDAGAYIGSHTLAMARAVGPQGTVHAFEPNPTACDQLRDNLRLNDLRNVEVYQAALGAERSRGYMRRADAGNVGGTHACTVENIARGELGCEGSTDPDAPFPMMRLDDLDLRDVSLIKIDVEGHEAAVIEGALRTIRDSRPVLVVEIWPDEKRREENLPRTRDELLQRILAFRYDIEQIDGMNFKATPRPLPRPRARRPAAPQGTP